MGPWRQPCTPLQLHKRAWCQEKEEGLPPSNGFLFAAPIHSWGMGRCSKWWMLLVLSPGCHRIGRNGSIILCCQGLTCCEVMWQLASKFATDNQALPNLKHAIWSITYMTNLSLQAESQTWILISNAIWLSIIFGKLLWQYFGGGIEQ